MTLVRVCPVEELPPGDRTILKQDEHSIGVFNIDGSFYAVENQCAHQGGPVCDGKQQGALVGEFVGDAERVKEFYSEEIPAIACPWHGWEYDLRTGDHLGDPEFGIPSYEVTVRDNVVYVEVE